MSRSRFFLALAIGFITCTALTAGTPPDDIDTRFKKDLSVQTAMARARLLLGDNQAQKAVEVLEEQLRNVNGNSAYLLLLRDAYRAHVRDLYLAGQPDQAKRYLDRLCILDPGAANDATLKPQAEPRKFVQDPAAKKASPSWPSFNPLNLPSMFGKKEEPTKPPVIQPGIVRAVPQEQSIVDDPFDGKNQREGTLDTSKAALARDLLTRGAAEFKNDRFAEARVYFEQAYQTDASSLEACKEQWAYCLLKGVSEAMEQPGVLPGRKADLQQQVEAAIRMAPTKMMASGQQLLEQLERRAKGPGMIDAGMDRAERVAKVHHWGQNREGWQVVKTAHFLIFHKQDSDFGERVAQIAESTRAAMFKKWFDSDGVEWDPICELVMHPSAASYAEMTKTAGEAPGHSRIEIESGRILSRRMDMRLDAPDILEAVLPHETTHVVLGGMFGYTLPPRWADEGIAILSEPRAKLEQHRRTFYKCHRNGKLFGLKELMELKDYPDGPKLDAFWGQSVVLCEFLTAQRDAKTLAAFVKDGMRHGYETALQRHYNMTFTQLEERWTQQVLNK